MPPGADGRTWAAARAGADPRQPARPLPDATGTLSPRSTPACARSGTSRSSPRTRTGARISPSRTRTAGASCSATSRDDAADHRDHDVRGDSALGRLGVPGGADPARLRARGRGAGGRPLLVPPSPDGDRGDARRARRADLLRRRRPRPATPTAPRRTRRRTASGPERDRAELALLEAALERDMPVLAVCRGSQVLNVALGGDLVQHLPEVVGHERHKQTPGVFADHDVEIAPGDEAAASVIGEHAPVKSHHHQGFGRLGEGLARGRPRRRRDGRGDRGPVAALRARRPLASRRRARTRRSSRRSSTRRARYRAERAVTAVLNPATEEPIAELPQAGVEETDAAVARAKAAFPAWRAVAPADRARLLRAARDARRGARARSSRGSSRATSASRSPARAARSAWSPRSSTSTRARSTSTTARRSRSPAAST